MNRVTITIAAKRYQKNGNLGFGLAAYADTAKGTFERSIGRVATASDYAGTLQEAITHAINEVVSPSYRGSIRILLPSKAAVERAKHADYEVRIPQAITFHVAATTNKVANESAANNAKNAAFMGIETDERSSHGKRTS